MAASIPESCKQDHCFLCGCEFLNAPKLLACCHSFCKECLQEKMLGVSSGDSMACPRCSMVMIVPVGGIDGLPDDFLEETKLQLAEIHDNKIKFCNVCKYIGEEILAFFYCINCQYHLCERDKKRHKATPSQRDHCVISYEEMTSGKYDPEIVTSTLGSCRQHSSESETKALTFYCKECEVLVCHECILATHKSHKLTSVQEVSNEYQKKIDDMLQKVCRKSEAGNDALESVKRDSEDSNKEKIEIVTKIENRGKYLTTAVNGLIQKMIQEVKTKQSAEEEKCEKFLKSLKDQTLCLENMKSFIDQFLEYSSDILTITHQKVITNNAEICLNNLGMKQKDPLKTYAFESKNDTATRNGLQELFGEFKEVSPEIKSEGMCSPVKTEPVWAYSNQKGGDDNKYQTLPWSQLTSRSAPSSVPVKTRFSLEKQWTIPNISDVTVTESGNIIILTPSAVMELVDRISLHTLHRSNCANLWNIDSINNDIYVSLKHTDRGFLILSVDGNIKYQRCVPEPLRTLRCPCGLAVDERNGTVLLCFGTKGRLYKCAPPFYCFCQLAEGLSTPCFICCDRDSNYIVSDRGNHSISKFNNSGHKLWQYGRKGSGSGQIDAPKGVCTDGQGRVYVADSNNDRIHVVSNKGVFLHFVSVGKVISSPLGLHYREGKLYVTSKGPDLLSIISCNM